MPRLPPRDVTADFYANFGEVDPDVARKVAAFVDWEKRHYAVKPLLTFAGDGRFGEVFSTTKGFKLLKAGRVLLREKMTKEKKKCPTTRRRTRR